MSSSALSQDCVLSHIATFLDFLDLCSLDGASRDISDDIADWEGGKPRAWLTVAGREGLSVMGVESKSCIKAAFGAIRGHDFRPEKFLMRSAKGTQELTKAAHQMKRKRFLERHAHVIRHAARTHPLPFPGMAYRHSRAFHFSFNVLELFWDRARIEQQNFNKCSKNHLSSC